MNNLLVCASMHSCLTITDETHHLIPFYDLSIHSSHPSLSLTPHISPYCSGACWVSAIYPVVSTWHAASPECQFNMALLKHMRTHMRSTKTRAGAIECLCIRPWLCSRDGEAECYHKQKSPCFYIKHKKRRKKYYFHLFFGTDMYAQLWILPCTQR